ncbi:MAG: hypothetical protein AB7F40_11510 [Victivallaceae bacterium]|nr:hypothetical protein [Victivallaceae bacterium]
MFRNRFNYGFFWLLLMFLVFLMPGKSIAFGLIAGLPPLMVLEYLGVDLRQFNENTVAMLSLLLVICGTFVYMMSYLMDRSRSWRGFAVLLAAGIAAGALALTSMACDYESWRRLPEVSASEDHFNVIYTREDYHREFLIPAAFAGGAAGLYAAALLGGTAAVGMITWKRRETKETVPADESEDDRKELL